jgi:hypothetical protein
MKRVAAIGYGCIILLCWAILEAIELIWAGIKHNMKFKMNNYIKTGICSLLLGLSGGIALQFGWYPIGFMLLFFCLMALMCGPELFE